MGSSVFADGANGGQVTTEGKISFYEETTDTTTEPSITKPSKPTSKKTLPNTGEELKNYSLLGILFIALVFFLFFFIKRKRRDQDD